MLIAEDMPDIAANAGPAVASILIYVLMAAVLLGQIALGLWMLGLPKDASGLRAGWFNVHKSWGMVLGLLVLVRWLWALRRPRVAPLAQAQALQWLATGAHWLLYALMLLSPLSGFLGSVFSGYPIRFFGLALPKLAEHWELGKTLMSGIHQWTTWALLLLIVLHVAAFVQHQFILKDAVLRRMR